MNVLITGAAGFVGTHLVDFLRTVPGYTLHGAVLEKPSTTDSPTDSHSEPYTPWVVDLRDEDAVRSVLEQIKPERIYHLAGQAYIPLSFDEPWDTLETNIRGTLTILQAVKTLKLDTRILVVGSAEIYGAAAVLPITEETPFLPSSPYSVSKIAQDMLAWQFYRAHKLHTIRVRPFNHIGPGQNARFAVADWAQQIVAAERGEREAVVSVGNLSAARDFTDVRDVVRAYYLATEKGDPGDVYNVCSGTPYTMQTILDTLIRLSTVPIRVNVDPQRVRPVEIPTLYGNYSHLRERTGWQPQIAIEQSLQDVLEQWRVRTT